MTGVDTQGSFEQARVIAKQGNLVVLCQDAKLLRLPALEPTSVKAEMRAAIEQIVPSTVKRSVAAIGDTSWASNSQPSLQEANQSIPFWGLLMGLSCIGHAVWVFQASTDLLCVGCSGADVLFVDSASVAALPADWQTQVSKVMRNPQILVHDRVSYKLLYAVPGQDLSS